MVVLTKPVVSRQSSSSKVNSGSKNSSSDSSSSDDDDSTSSSSNSSSSTDEDDSDSSEQEGRGRRSSGGSSRSSSSTNKPSSTTALPTSTSTPTPTPTLTSTSPAKKEGKKVLKKVPSIPTMKSKLIKSGTVTNTRTIKPLVPLKKPTMTAKKPVPAKKPAKLKIQKPPPPVAKPPPVKPAKAVVPVKSTITASKIPLKSVGNKKVVKPPSIIPSKTMKTEDVESSIIRTRSSCSEISMTTTDDEERDIILKKKIAIKVNSSDEEVNKESNKKRPVTRRQKLAGKNKKTIPTTTLFNQSLLLNSTTLNSDSSPSNNSQSNLQQKVSSKNKYLSTWDSDFSDDQQSNSNLIRVPAKTSLKPANNIDYYDSYQPPTCPFPCCDSSGHLSGKYPTHNFLSCCPKYNGLTEEECEKNDSERSRRETERSRYRDILSTPGKKPPKQTGETKTWLGQIKDLKGSQVGVVSCYDDCLWKDAMALAADCIEKEQNEGGINNTQAQSNFRVATMAVAMGRFEMKCWCDSPYPEPLSQNRRLFVCEFCLKPVGSGTVLRRHCAKCVWRHPPGDEIYRKDRLSVWEVDGKKQKTYCQNLCLLAKCFLDHKTLYLDVDPFLFYVMTLADSQGCHIVGYFSKEKNSFLNYNVSCILTLPPYQRQGFGRLLIDFSYLLTRVEGKVGSPEKPLSDLGLISYRSYWKDACLRRLCACASREINIKDLSLELGVSTADLISTLQYLGMLKYWKGKHLVLKKQDVLEEYLERVRRRGNEQRQIDSSCLRWRPYQPPIDEQSSEEKS